jgi:hypothetical protein
MPEAPTSAWPGSAAKIAVLEERARKEQCLFHPKDPRLDRSDDEACDWTATLAVLAMLDEP